MIQRSEPVPGNGAAAMSFTAGSLLQNAVIFLCGFLAVQRFTLGIAGALVCMVPLLLAVFAGIAKRNCAAVSYLLLALVFCVDNGGGAYPETPAPIRYAIYSGVFLVLLLSSAPKVRTGALIVGLLVLAGLCVGTLCSLLEGSRVSDSLALRRDLIVLAVLFVFVLARSDLALDLGTLFAGALGYLFGEVINLLLYYSGGVDYLSYNSLKSFVVFPVLYAMLRKQARSWQFFLMVCTLPVVFLYGTRMITLSLLLLVLLVPLIRSIRRGTIGIYVVLTAFGVLLVWIDVVAILDIDAIERAKALSFFLVLVQNFDSSDLLAMFAVLDPVRFAEHQLFFSRSVLEILFGSGLGSGIADPQGVLSFVRYDQTAFSSEELRTSTYFNLHDFWIDFGLRFGIVPVLLLMVGLAILPMWRGWPWQGVLFGLLLINTTYATAGILFTAAIVRLFPRDAA